MRSIGFGRFISDERLDEVVEFEVLLAAQLGCTGLQFFLERRFRIRSFTAFAPFSRLSCAAPRLASDREVERRLIASVMP